MISSSSPRETIQVSLGSSANAITAHLLNLQGLATTSSTSAQSVYCEPNVTHCVQRSGNSGSGTLVPRVLLVDEAIHQVPATLTTGQETAPNGFDPSSSAFYADSFWNGQVQVLGDSTFSSATAAAWSDCYQNQGGSARSPSQFWKTSAAMAHSPHSRYHCSIKNDQPAHQYRADPTNSRHVVWDDDEEEDEEDPYERARRQEQDNRQWRTQTAVVLGQELERQMTEEFQVADERSPPEESSLSVGREFHLNHWTDIWMPPRNDKSKVVLPFSSQSRLVPHWNVSYQNGLPFLQEWKEDTFFENVRHMLESCDYGIQGVSIATEGHGIYASLATCLLEELKQECKSAGRLIYHLRDEKKSANQGSIENGTDVPTSPSSWQEAKVDQIRKQVSSGLALYDFTEKAHAVLPLQLPEDRRVGSNGSVSNSSFFRSTAEVAMALEASTLPFRFDGKCGSAAMGRLPKYQIGLQNSPFLVHGSSDTSWGSAAPRLTFSEYLQVLQPSSSHSMLELDVLSHNPVDSSPITNSKLFETIQEGTSVERDQRTRQSRGHSYRTRPREVPPGSWLRDAQPDSAGTKGLLSSLSYAISPTGSSANLDRSVHHHFALSTSVRSKLTPLSADGSGSTLSNYLTCLVQGMGIQYRPERSMATVLNQSLGQLTFDGEGGGGNYGAGIYWKYIVRQVDTPVVAVLGNSTRAYSSLDSISKDMKDAMKSSRSRGFYNRDVTNGVIPELEDCEEALEACWNKRDVYQPPMGSGLAEEDY
mmetsp:Transcript_83951/g.170270  ORF Transcript_83951/g.170270 Transcript_83951/m.170270 type:complete len:761 (+) Transcript_83951:461-2743(+)|eukprot:CAMPEP_0201199402 /NCGR_PEP_ID=MMETSP0851-20130426/158805_1 /ASSEMBLY_ACC=CAM_ASM_000631 /TAXON_ID=183588 /ORGANISM="Pseudo-nitzschia fraudulenta, Strain WWA7" /LENGTH=760 /DNA_ID=CAMNT_0047486795 /DNA_START=143 /DNA_END=2425 /DNA_ORIENTATION=+